MARTRQRRRRLWDAYCFPGFRPQPTVHGVFGDPKARVIKLKRRSKKRFADAVVVSRWAGSCGCKDVSLRTLKKIAVQTENAWRELTRARETAMNDLRAKRQQISAFLLRHKS